MSLGLNESAGSGSRKVLIIINKHIVGFSFQGFCSVAKKMLIKFSGHIPIRQYMGCIF